MSEIVLNPDQAETVSSAEGPIKVRDGTGREMGLLVRTASGTHRPLKLSKEEIDQLADRMTTGGPWSTTQEVLQQLQSAENK